tara:strand:- start:103 stop:936 length:834 start_codon:yes stop_codon:yes gene_type:complete
MKKILGIVVLCLLLSGNAHSLTQDEAIKNFLSNKKLERIEGIWLADQGKIIVIYKKGNSYYGKTIYSSMQSSGDTHVNISSGSSNFFSGRGPCSIDKEYTSWGKQKKDTYWYSCKISGSLVNDNVLRQTNDYPADSSIGFAGATQSFQFTRIWPDNIQAHNSSFKSKDDVIEEDRKLANIINDAKKTCKVLGFKEESEKFADCTLKLYTQKVEELVAEKQLKNQQIIASQSSSSNTTSNQSSGSNVTTIYDPVRDSQNLMNKGQKMLSGGCTLGIDC